MKWYILNFSEYCTESLIIKLGGRKVLKLNTHIKFSFNISQSNNDDDNDLCPRQERLGFWVSFSNSKNVYMWNERP